MKLSEAKNQLKIARGQLSTAAAAAAAAASVVTPLPGGTPATPTSASPGQTPSSQTQVPVGAAASPAQTLSTDQAKERVKAEAQVLTETWLKRKFTQLTVVLALAGIFGVTLAFIQAPDLGWSPARIASAWASPITAALLIGLGYLAPGYSKGGLVGYIIGKDNRLSTSKAQVGLWTIAIVFTFIFFTFQLMFTANTTALAETFKSFGPEYLLLLGGPFAAAVLAQATTATKTEQGSVQQVPAAAPSETDLVTDQDGKPAIADAQFFLFNVVALVYFAVALIRAPEHLPTLPSTLVALTSISALTYLGAKVATSNPPSITTVTITSPSSDGYLHPGQTTIKIVGKGFNPPGNQTENQQDVAVLFNNVEVKPEPGFTDTVILAKVPAGLTTTPANTGVDIAVRTAAQVVTEPYSKLVIK